MNPSLRKKISRALRVPLVWKLTQLTLGNASRFYRRIEALRSAESSPEENQRIEELFQSRAVLHGPFRGMRYPPECTLNCRRLGSYEAELEPTLERLFANDYGTVVNVGCGTGYYAVGLARRLPRAKICAFDADPEQLRLSRATAELNGVASQIEFAGFCSRQSLLQIELSGRALVVSDCEGYELELFQGELLPKLKNHDLIIESHDFANIETTKLLRERFEPSHTITEIDSTDDTIKAYRYEYPELRAMSLALRRRILEESRRRTMRWLVLESRTANPA